MGELFILFGFYCRIVEFFHPEHPQEEDDEVEEQFEYIVVSEVEGVDIVTEEVDVDVGPLDLHDQDATDAYHIGPFDDNESCRNVPQLVFPRTGEEQHEENPVHPLL